MATDSLATKRTLGSFEGKDVIAVGMEIPGAAGGLREPLKVDPVELEIDDVVYGIFKLRTDKVRFVGIKETDALQRVHIMETIEATLVSADLAIPALAAQAKRIEDAKAQQVLPLDGEPGPVSDAMAHRYEAEAAEAAALGSDDDEAAADAQRVRVMEKIEA